MDHPYGIIFDFSVGRFYKMDHPYGIILIFLWDDSTKWIIPTGLF